MYKIFAINPGSTSTKIAMFEDDEKIFSANVAHEAEDLKRFPEISDQFDYRKDMILEEVHGAGLTLEDCDAFSGRGGGQPSRCRRVHRCGEGHRLEGHLP